MSLSAGTASYLRAPNLVASASSGHADAFGAEAQRVEVASPLVARADAQAEAGRQLAFRAGPMVKERHRVAGEHDELVGRTVSINGEDAFVLGARPERGRTTTLLTVLRRLG
ncbi:hypothetical protein B5C34_05180 [Pacificimonas flava]|uniref:Uncharacterized protein n=2 Tax=Pacificimonas TaxID=1960290 RepID=A0A219B3Z6_9SPHN|nr:MULTISPECIES: hypothetical protein [Pacificimonas]MBZ6377389.1 hypothetical protein [Pacificimonas aurantium]OWV32904.1 hypothetical protein B5C34_05180 [Pacificimonas flava]